jgi:DNA (cytosine-5)-methyltransferase 1
VKYLSVCSGIEAATVAWHGLGWKPFAFSEIEKFPSQVLAHHYPNVPNLGDMTKFKEWPDAAIDLLVGGTPCQSFSVAGLRKGLADPRGNLMLTFGAIADKYRPQWLVWENVPGVLSSNGGRDFGTFLGMLGELGYGFAYRVLDAQYFGVAQRRRRVFVIGCLGNWRAAAAVLFERASLSGNPAPSRETGKAAPTIPSRSTAGGGLGTGFDLDGGLITKQWPAEVAPALDTTLKKYMGYDNQHINGGAGWFVPGITHSLCGEGFDASEDGTGRGTPLVPVAGPLAFDCKTSGRNGFGVGPISPTLRSMNSDTGNQNAGGQVAVAFTMDINKSDNPGSSQGVQIEHSNTLRTEKVPAVIRGMQVRRLTPRECERLQGFQWQCSPEYPGAWQDDFGIWWTPDYTLINYRGKPAADGPRYKALGNSMARPVMHWIGRRIDLVSSIMKLQRTAA